jgi:hypothetical protein
MKVFLGDRFVKFCYICADPKLDFMQIKLDARVL